MDRYRIFRRGKIWYLEHDATGKQRSLHTRDKQEAQRILNAQYEAHQNPSANLQIARIYMNVADEKYAKRTGPPSYSSAVEGLQADRTRFSSSSEQIAHLLQKARF